jgi:hypothetical protein
MTPQVQEVFEGFVPEARAGLMRLRALILREAEAIGPVEETLRWGQPAYIVKGGSPIRLGVPKTGGFALYVICSTSLIDDFRPVAPKDMRVEGKRAVLFASLDEIDEGALALLIRRALRYHAK